MKTFNIAILIALFALSSFAATITLDSVNGMSDGSNYVGFVDLSIDGLQHNALCIDSLHEVHISETWTADVLPISSNLTFFMANQFGVSDFLPALAADAWAFEALTADPGNAVFFQHAVWGQFDPRYDGSPIAGNTPPDLSSFFVVAALGGQQSFLIQETITPEPVSLALVGCGLLILALRRKRSA